MKKVIKQKNKYLKKCEDGTPLFGSTSLPMADSNMIQGYDSGMSSYPDFSQPEQKQKTSASSVMGGIGAAAGAVSSIIPYDESKHSSGANKALAMKEGVAKSNIPFVSWGASADAMISKAIPGKGGETAGQFLNPIFGGLAHLGDKNLTAKEKALYFLPGGNLAVEEENPLFDKKFEEKLAGSNINFGQAQAKYGMPLFKDGGKVEPIYTDNPKDKRFQAYNDSLKLYNGSVETEKLFRSNLSNEEQRVKFKELNNRLRKVLPNAMPIKSINIGTDVVNYFKKPVQPIIYKKKEEVKVPIPKKKFTFPDEQEGNEEAYQSWRKTLPKNLQYEGDYDLKGFYKENPNFKAEDKNQHLTDKYKLPNHPTFSVESKYYKEGMPAGKWDGDDYIPINRGNPLPDYLTQTVKTPMGTKTYKRKDDKSPWMEQYAMGGLINNRRNFNAVNDMMADSIYSPDGKFFSSPEQYQRYQDLYYPQQQGQQPIINNYGRMKFKPMFKNNSFFALGGVPYQQGDIEAEKGEALLEEGNKIQSIEGEKHENGGTPLKLDGDEQYIYSDRLGYDKKGIPTINLKDVAKSFASKAKSIESKYSKKNDDIANKTKELELGKLTQDAEQARVAKEQIDMTKKVKAKYGANLKKFYGGGTPFTEFPQLSYDEQVDPKSTLFMQNQILQQDPNALPKYGADGLWGKETQTAMDNSPFGPRENLNSIANISPMVPKGFQKLEVPSIDTLNFDPKKIDSTINPKEKRNGLFQNLTQGDKLQLAGMLPGTLYNIEMGLKKAEKEHFYKNPYNDEIMSIMANRRYDPQSYLNEANMANTAMNQNISDNSTSVGVKLANMRKGHANFLSSIADITGKSQELNNNYRAQEATVKGQLGEVLRQEGVRVSGVNAQNKAAKQAFMAKGITQLGQGISSVGQASNQSLTNTMLAKSLSEISPDFDMNKLADLYNRNKVDKDGYFTYAGTKYQYVPTLNRVIKAS